MPLPDAATSSVASTAMTLVTVNPYAYLATLTRHETYGLLIAAAALALAGAVLIQEDAARRLLRGIGRRARRR